MRSRVNRIVGLLLTLGCALPLVGGVLLASAAPASASSYRYWTYWWGRPDRTAWQYASLGPAADMPGDGWVLGWRFQITSPTGGGAQAPRTSLAYADLCSDPAPAADQERVAVVVDYGDASAAPAGEAIPAGPRTVCVVVPVHSHGSDVMRAASVSLRLENGFVCGIDGYPMLGCATPVADSPTPTATPTPTHTHSPTPTSKPSPAASHTTSPPSHSTSPSSSTSAAATTAASSPAATPAVIPSTGGTSTPSASPRPTNSAVVAPADSPSPSATTPKDAVIATQPAKVTDSRNALGLIAGIAGVALLGGSAWFTTRRRGGTR